MVALPQGTHLDKFVIDRVLGEGGFGITYLAEDPVLEKKFAIKEYFPQSWASRDQTDSKSISVNTSSKKDYGWGLKRFLEEARTLAKFSHPHIVNVTSILEANNTAYMVLDYADGQDFGSWLKGLGRPPAQEELDAISLSLLDALGLVHANGILHRDIAPDNIYIRHDGSPVLLDFGAARDAIGKRTGTISAIVKQGYSPFEQYSTSGKDQGPWTDIYALGATLYKAVTGKPPPEAIDRIAKDDYVPARNAARGDYREGFLAAIDHALRPSYGNRPQTLNAWRKGLFSGRVAPDLAVGKGILRWVQAKAPVNFARVGLILFMMAGFAVGYELWRPPTPDINRSVVTAKKSDRLSVLVRPAPKPGPPVIDQPVPLPPRSSDSIYVVQVASRRSQALALAVFADLQQKYAGLLGQYQPQIQSADLGDNGTWYRLRVGLFSKEEEAETLCRKLKNAGLQSCAVRPL